MIKVLTEVNGIDHVYIKLKIPFMALVRFYTTFCMIVFHVFTCFLIDTRQNNVIGGKHVFRILGTSTETNWCIDAKD